MTSVAFLACTCFGIWLYVNQVRDLAHAERNGVYERLRDGDRAAYLRQFWIKIMIAAMALVMAGYSAVLALS